MIRIFLPDSLYIPGIGVAAGFIMILGIGLLLHIWLFRKLFEWGERLMEKLPLIQSLYGSMRDLMRFFDSSKKKDFDKVVMVTLSDNGARMMGLVTRDTFNDLSDGVGDRETIAVYLPMSYQMGGFTLFVPKGNI